MTFTTSCFVRVKDPEKRKKLTEWLESIDYEYSFGHRQDGDIVQSLYISGQYAQYSQEWCASGIDCGDNIELFKALAAMNDENDYQQWFFNGWSSWEYCPYNKIHDKVIAREMISSVFFHKATAAEIVEHFKK